METEKWWHIVASLFLSVMLAEGQTRAALKRGTAVIPNVEAPSYSSVSTGVSNILRRIRYLPVLLFKPPMRTLKIVGSEGTANCA